MSAVRQRRDRVAASSSSCPDEVINEILLPERGQTVYWLALADEEVELLSRGECPETVARQAWQMLSWKRLNNRKQAQDQAHTEDLVHYQE